MIKKFKSAFTAFFFTGICLTILGCLALLFHHPLIFPSLGPTAFLVAATPLSKLASPKNTILGHLIGICCGYFALLLFGLTNTPAIIISGISIYFIAAAALSLALTSFFMLLFSVEHPPAGATTLIIALGIMHTPSDISVLLIAVILLSVLAWGINHFRGINYPLWQLKD